MTAVIADVAASNAVTQRHSATAYVLVAVGALLVLALAAAGASRVRSRHAERTYGSTFSAARFAALMDNMSFYRRPGGDRPRAPQPPQTPRPVHPTQPSDPQQSGWPELPAGPHHAAPARRQPPGPVGPAAGPLDPKGTPGSSP